jgi:hypothetical protein
MMSIEEDIVKVGELLQRVDPLIQKYIHQIMDRHGHDVCLSVAANISTTLMTLAILIVERRGGDIDPFVQMMMKEVKGKFDNAHASHATQELLSKIMTLGPSANWNTCRPPPTRH